MIRVILAIVVPSLVTSNHGSPAANVFFSNPLTDLLPADTYRTCIIGNFAGPGREGLSQIHHWKFLSRGDGDHEITLEITATSVSALDNGGSIIATGESTAGPVTVTLAHPTYTGVPTDASVSLVVLVTGGVGYDLTVVAVPPDGILGGAGYAGPNSIGPPPKSGKAAINSVKNALDDFNNNGC